MDTLNLSKLIAYYQALGGDINHFDDKAQQALLAEIPEQWQQLADLCERTVYIALKPLQKPEIVVSKEPIITPPTPQPPTPPKPPRIGIGDFILKVTFPDGTVLCNPHNQVETFVQALCKIGLDEIEKHDFRYDKKQKFHLITSTPRDGLQYRQVGNRYIFTNSSTIGKTETLGQLNRLLNLNLDIQCIAKDVDQPRK